MDIITAYKILGANEIDTLQAIKSKFYRLAMLHHPDRDSKNDIELMKKLNLAYELLRKNHVKISENMEKDFDAYHIKYDISEDILKKAIKIQKLSSYIDVYIAGAWIWISGDTKPIKEALKQENCRFAPKKKAWYFAGCRSFSRGKYSLNEIYTKYGKYEPRDNILQLA